MNLGNQNNFEIWKSVVSNWNVPLGIISWHRFDAITFSFVKSDVDHEAHDEATKGGCCGKVVMRGRFCDQEVDGSNPSTRATRWTFSHLFGLKGLLFPWKRPKISQKSC